MFLNDRRPIDFQLESGTNQPRLAGQSHRLAIAGADQYAGTRFGNQLVDAGEFVQYQFGCSVLEPDQPERIFPAGLSLTRGVSSFFLRISVLSARNWQKYSNDSGGFLHERAAAKIFQKI